MPRFEGRKFAEIEREDMEQYVIQRCRAQAKAGTIRKEFGTIKRMWNLAIAWEVVTKNVVNGVHTPKLLPDRLFYLEPAQLPHLLECCPQWLRPIVVFAIATGMRRGEFCKLQYMDVSREQSRLYIKTTKNNKPRGVPLNETAKLALDAVWNPKARPTDRVFTNYRLDYVTGAFMRARNKAGIPYFRLHDCRHTFASWLAMSGERLQVIGELLGHADPRMTQKYAHLSLEHLRDAVSKIDPVFLPELKAMSQMQPFAASREELIF
jgi:integrase